MLIFERVDVCISHTAVSGRLSSPIPRMMKRLTFVLILLLGGLSSLAQKKYAIQSGSILFTSNAQLELIKASSDKVQGLLDPSTNQFAFTIDVKSFQGFNSELQREHFNEKYMESEKFPRARFSGKIIEQIDLLGDGTHDVRAKGDLEIHGQKQTRIIRSKVTIKNGTATIESAFLVPLADHNISIPSIVSQKIATEIEVNFKANMTLR